MTADNAPPTRRFLRLEHVAEQLAITKSQVYALVRNGELPAIKVGSQGKWRVERAALEAYIARLYDETSAFTASHPLRRAARDDEPRS